jgi:hypothetical protein
VDDGVELRAAKRSADVRMRTDVTDAKPDTGGNVRRVAAAEVVEHLHVPAQRI